MRYLLLICFFWAAPSFAMDFSGTWEGIGLFESTSMGRFDNSAVTVNISQTNTSLTIEDCWKFKKEGSNWTICSPSELGINYGHELWYQDTKIGEIFDDRIIVNTNFAGTKIVGKVTMEENGTLSFFYEAKDHTGSIMQEAFGLKKVH